MYFIDNKIRVVEVQDILVEDNINVGDYIRSGTYKILDYNYYNIDVTDKDVSDILAGEVVLTRLHEATDHVIDGAPYVAIDSLDPLYQELSGVVTEYFAVMTPLLDSEGLATTALTAHNSLGGYTAKERQTLANLYEDLFTIITKLDNIDSYDNEIDIELEV